MRTLLHVISLIAAASAAAATVQTFRFAESDLLLGERDGCATVQLKESGIHAGEIGSPCVPARFFNIVVPAGSRVTGLKVSAQERLLHRSLTLRPVQPSVVYDGRPAPRDWPPDAKCYQSSEMYPAQLARLVGVGEMRGFTLAQVEVNPVRYRANRGEVYFADEVTVELELEAAPRAAVAVPTRPPPEAFRTLVKSIVVNPEAVDEVAAAQSVPAVATLANANAQSTVDYLIITSAGLSNSWQALASHRTTHDGLKCEVKTTASIYSSYSGRDDPEKIRNCIIDYANNKGTLYVLLGGDGTHAPTNNPGYVYDPIVPCRYATANYWDTMRGWSSESFPCDLYYADTTGNWDKDGDNVFGETSTAYGVEGDMYPDVFLARLPMRNTASVNNYVNKLIRFETSPPPADFYRRFMLVGNQGFASYTGNARPADLVNDGLAQFRDHSPVSDCEIWLRRAYRDFAQASGFVPSDFKLFTDTLTSYDGGGAAGSYELNRANLLAKLNDGGRYFLFEGSHGYRLGWYMEPENNAFAVSDAKALTRIVAVVSTIACNTADFDAYEDASGNYESCLSDAMLRNGNGGALAYIGATGLSVGDDTDPYCGATFRMNAELYRQLFAAHKTTIGEAFAGVKAAYAPQCTGDGDYRYMQFSLILQGDPAMTVVAVAPALRIAVSGATATVAWPRAASSHYALQTSTDLANPANWVDLTNPAPHVVGNELHCVVPATNSAAYFRLRGN